VRQGLGLFIQPDSQGKNRWENLMDATILLEGAGLLKKFGFETLVPLWTGGLLQLCEQVARST
jgi:hypothetical protein